MKKSIALFFSAFCLSSAFAQCDNIGFENGTSSGWTCGVGTFGQSGITDCDTSRVLPLLITGSTCASGPVNATKDPMNDADNRHIVMGPGSGTDPNSLGNVTCVAPNSMFPAGTTNRYSFRIGNANGGLGQTLSYAESIKYTLTVSKDNAGLTYMYSTFLNDPDHPKKQAPRFEIKIYEMVNGKEQLVTCGYYQVAAGGKNVNFHQGKESGTNNGKTSYWTYTDWTKVGLDLSGYIGKQVTIEFTTADCFPSQDDILNTGKCRWSPGSHSAYAYIDLYCAPIEIKSPDICANQPSVQLCGPDGYASYEWDPGPGIQPPLNQKCVTIKNPKAGDVYTVNMKSVAGGCPTKTTIKLAGADFTVNDVTTCPNAPTTLTVTPSNGTVTDYEWKWEPATYLSCTNCPNPVFTPGANSTYTVTMIDKKVANCNQVKTVKVTVGAGFTVTTAGAHICEGETATLTASGADTYVWNPGNLTGTTVTVNPTSTTTYTVTGSLNGGTCPGNGTATALVTVDKLPTVSAGADQTICIGESATLGGSIGGSATGGTWTGGTGTFTPNNTTLTATYKPSPAEEAAGTVTLTLTTDAPGLCPAKESKTTITINKVAEVDAGPTQKICAGGSVTLAGVFSGGAVSGSWSGGTGVYAPNSSTPNAVYTPSKSEQAAGKVILTFTTNDPPGTCPAVNDTMSILIDQMPVAIAGDAANVCAGTVIKLNGKVQGAATQGTWTGGNGTFTKDNHDLTGTYTPTAQEIAAGKVKLILTTNSTGLCPIAVDSVTHFIYPNPIIKFSVDTPRACPPHCVNFFDSTSAGGTKITKWDWNFGKNYDPMTSTDKNPKSICFYKPGKYDVSLTATSEKGCTSSLKKDYYIETYEMPKAMFTANPWQVSQYDPVIHFTDQSTSDVPIITWVWNLGDGKIVSPKTKNPVHKYEVGVWGTYNVKLYIINDHGCVDSITRPVEVLPEFTFYIPNAFTPNRNDGINDTFFGKGVGIVEYHIWIFDRWGNMIFNTKDINEGWDGRANNGAEIAQQDVYVWKVQLKDIFGKKHDYIGTVTLVR